MSTGPGTERDGIALSGMEQVDEPAQRDCCRNLRYEKILAIILSVPDKEDRTLRFQKYGKRIVATKEDN